MFLLIMRLEECGLYCSLIRYPQNFGKLPEAWSSIIDAIIKGPFIAANIVPYMIKNKIGKIINISTSRKQ